MPRFHSTLDLARQLSRCTENLKPPVYTPIDDALAIVRRVLHLSFLTPDAVDGPEAHAFFATCAMILAGKVRRIPLTDADVSKLYRSARKAKAAALDTKEAAFLTKLGISGVHIFDSDVTGEDGDGTPAA